MKEHFIFMHDLDLAVFKLQVITKKKKFLMATICDQNFIL